MHTPNERVGRLRLWISTLPAVVLLMAVIGTASLVMVYSQLSQLGESLWPDYNRLLRFEPSAPECDPVSLKARLDALDAPRAPAKAAAAGGGDDVDALFDDDAPQAPASAPAGDDVDALFDDPPAAAPASAPAAPASAADGDDVDALFDDDDAPAPGNGAPANAAAGDDGDDVDALFDDDPTPKPAAGGAAAMSPARQSLMAALAGCEARHAEHRDVLARRTDGVVQFRQIESVVEQLRDLGIGYQRHLLVLLFLLCALTATALRGHIALRPPHTRWEHRTSELAQIAVATLLTLSVWKHKSIDEASGIDVQNPELYWMWVIGFVGMAALSVFNLLRVPKDAPTGFGPRVFLSVPLYCTMGLIAGAWFLLGEDHPAGLSIYLTKITEFAKLYLQVGLYVWIGMLLKRTRLAELAFDLVRPFKLPPELLAFVVVVAAALPTAYSGASGIFVIAVGAVIYDELRRAGARRQLALAATAMSGSLGVVLNPCLLVVIVASLNKQVTTDQLFGWGFKVFLLTSILFFVASLLSRQGPIKVKVTREVWPQVGAAVKRLVPYVLIAGAIIAFDGLVLKVTLDENNAAILLPVILLALLIFDSRSSKKAARKAAADPASVSGTDAPDAGPAQAAPVGFFRLLEQATTETTGHIGALLALMGLSICLGGIVERADLMANVPETFGSVYTAMGMLVGVLVIIGMTMDPYGAVILVSATIADVAYRNGIDPVHFWMVVLVAFELGYLTPPVALNHLLTRQVVGEHEVDEGEAETVGRSFWARHERVALPVAVMGVALLMVAFGPLLFGY